MVSRPTNLEIDWKYTYLIPRSCTQDVNLRNFQFKILHRTLCTNTLLYKFGMNGNKKCTFCNYEDEDLYHLLWQCYYANIIWRKFSDLLQVKCNIGYKIDKMDAMFGCRINNNNNLLNCCFLIIRRYIYICRCNSSLPSIAGMISFLKRNREIEINSYRYFSSNKIPEIIQKWQPMDNLLK